MKPIPDHLKKGLDIVFVGFNPSIRSSETGYHYANPNNRFWTILYEAGLTPRKFTPSENRQLLNLGFGLTNIVERPTKEALDITKKEYGEGRLKLKEKLIYYQPKIVCFVGKGVYEQFSNKRNIQWGVQKEPVIQEFTEFVAPSSSGLVRMKKVEIVAIYKQLTTLLPNVKTFNI